MPSYSKVILIGHLTADPEPKTTGGGSNLTEFSIGVNRKTKDGEDQPNFFDVTVWGKTADFVCEHFTKGKAILVEGELRQDRWTNDAGDKRSKVCVTGHKVFFVGSKTDAPSGNGSEPQRKPAESVAEEAAMVGGAAGDDDRLPF